MAFLLQKHNKNHATLALFLNHKTTKFEPTRPFHCAAKSINAVSRANFGIVIGVHPSTLQIKKKQDRPRPFLGPIRQ